jgi:hypothetical protein
METEGEHPSIRSINRASTVNPQKKGGHKNHVLLFTTSYSPDMRPDVSAGPKRLLFLLSLRPVLSVLARHNRRSAGRIFSWLAEPAEPKDPVKRTLPLAPTFFM